MGTFQDSVPLMSVNYKLRGEQTVQFKTGVSESEAC